MRLEVLIVNDLMNKSGESAPLIIRQRIGKRGMPFKVIMLGDKAVEQVCIEQFFDTAGAVPE